MLHLASRELEGARRTGHPGREAQLHSRRRWAGDVSGVLSAEVEEEGQTRRSERQRNHRRPCPSSSVGLMKMLLLQQTLSQDRHRSLIALPRPP